MRPNNGFELLIQLRSIKSGNVSTSSPKHNLLFFIINQALSISSIGTSVNAESSLLNLKQPNFGYKEKQGPSFEYVTNRLLKMKKNYFILESGKHVLMAL